MNTVRIALVGDHDPAVTAHRAIPLAIQRAAKDLAKTIAFEWLATDSIDDEKSLQHFDGIWCVPASPYRSMQGALTAIRFARQNGVPFFGSCGGFQHAVVEYARHVLLWHDADHAETAPEASRAVIAPLSCALVEVEDNIQLLANTRLARAYGVNHIREGYRCRFGMNPAFQQALLSGQMRAAAVDDHGDVRAIEIPSHRFFVATLFQPERAVLRDAATPIADAFVHACCHFANEK